MKSLTSKTTLYVLLLLACYCTNKCYAQTVWKETIATISKNGNGVRVACYKVGNREFCQQIGESSFTVIGEKFVMRYDEANPNKYKIDYWQPIFLDSEKTRFVYATLENITHPSFFAHFYTANYSYCPVPKGKRIKKWILLPDNYRELYPDLENERYYRVQLWDSNMYRAVLHFDMPIKSWPTRDSITATTPIGVAATYLPGSTYLLSGLSFKEDMHTPDSSSFAVLDNLFNILNNNKQLKIAIEGHVCCITHARDAMDAESRQPFLSLNRAKAVYDYLISKGIGSKRMSYEGFGRNRPVIPDEKTQAHAAKNRRIEIRIVE